MRMMPERMQPNADPFKDDPADTQTKWKPEPMSRPVSRPASRPIPATRPSTSGKTAIREEVGSGVTKASHTETEMRSALKSSKPVAKVVEVEEPTPAKAVDLELTAPEAPPAKAVYVPSRPIARPTSGTANPLRK
jgi:hypothetical protein